MKQHRMNTVGSILLAGSFFLVANSIAADFDEDTYGPEAPILWEQPTKVSFSHKTHTMEASLSCDSCHDELFTMESGAALATGTMTMAAMLEGQYCGSCHDGNTAFATNVQCASCHMDMTELIPIDLIVWTKPVKAVIFDHKTHIEDSGLECEACHDSLFAMETGTAEKTTDFTMQALYDGKYCGKCHDDSTAFAANTRCNDCHIGVKGYNRLMGNDGQHGKNNKAGH